MKKKITLLVLHIVLAIIFGVIAVFNTNMVSAIFGMIASIMWSVCVGIETSQLIMDY